MRYTKTAKATADSVIPENIYLTVLIILTLNQSIKIHKIILTRVLRIESNTTKKM